MSDEGNALKDEVHLPCPDGNCNGSIIFIGFTGMVKWFKCCICGREFENRRAIDKPINKERRCHNF